MLTDTRRNAETRTEPAEPDPDLSKPSRSVKTWNRVQNPDLTLSLGLVRVPAPHDLPGVLPDPDRPPLGSLGLLLVEQGHHGPDLQTVQDPGPGLGPVQGPGGRDRTGGLLCAPVGAAEPGCTHGPLSWITGLGRVLEPEQNRDPACPEPQRGRNPVPSSGSGQLDQRQVSIQLKVRDSVLVL